MAYKNIHFIKVKMELLEDHRFLFHLNDRQKGLYLMLLALAGKTNNAICDDMTFIMGRLNLKDISRKDLEKISEVYPKFKLIEGFWKFDNFDHEHNQILTRNIPGISQEYAKNTQSVDKNRIEKNRKRIEKKRSIQRCTEQFLLDLKTNPAYSHINLDREFKLMDAWLEENPGRVKSKRFVIGWLNRVEAPLPKEQSNPYAGLRKLVM